MEVLRFIHVVIRQMKWLVGLPLLAGALMYLLTMNQSKEYATKATVFTAIASSSSLNDMGNSRVDFFTTKAAYNNLISIINSRSVIEETALRLLALHLSCLTPNEAFLSHNNFSTLTQNIPDEIRQLGIIGDEEKTFENLSAFMSQDKANYLYGLLNFDHPHYSYKAISAIKTVQVGGSDIIEFSYVSNDPGVAYQTLNILIDVFLKRYSDLKINRTNEVIGYFERQLSRSLDELNAAEDRLLDFNASNSIVNYYEQTKHISSQQEKIEIKLQDVLLEYEAAQAILSKLELETASRFDINLKTKAIMSIRSRLIEVNRQLAEVEITEITGSSATEDKTLLQGRRQKLEANLQNKMDSLYIYNKHSDGIAIESLLNDWLKNVIDYESAKARLLAMQEKSKEFKNMYNQYAPLGATLKRIEREIDVKEKAYLEILHHLGLARLKQQNDEMMSNMKLMDEPYLPIDPVPTKRKLIVIVVSFFTFLFTLLGLFLFELLDKTIKTNTNFSRLAKLSVPSAIPLLPEQADEADLLLVQRGIKSSVERILKERVTNDINAPLIVQVLSHWKGEGKTRVINIFDQQLSANGYHVTQANQNDIQQLEDCSNISLINRDNGPIVNNETEVFTKSIVLMEVPALSAFVLKSSMLSLAKLHFLVADANRTWSSADSFIQTQLNELASLNLLGVLNKTKPDNMEEMIGEIPKNRSSIRRFVKQNLIGRFLS